MGNPRESRPDPAPADTHSRARPRPERAESGHTRHAHSDLTFRSRLLFVSLSQNGNRKRNHESYIAIQPRTDSTRTTARAPSPAELRFLHPRGRVAFATDHAHRSGVHHLSAVSPSRREATYSTTFSRLASRVSRLASRDIGVSPAQRLDEFEIVQEIVQHSDKHRCSTLLYTLLVGQPTPEAAKGGSKLV